MSKCKCNNCGKEGPHFVPPSIGEEGFFICERTLDREKLADLCHKQWSGWMKYLFDNIVLNENCDTIIPEELVNRWTRQINTPYNDLPEKEKESDRKEADKFITLIGGTP